ncbi:transcription factor HHO5 isoform X3 [Trifolium pratense]|uniref:transcription factor HHO5 isoform X3 n=1 Tax=Trifolium pratense TaxID=57577 RepID=UPI001E690E5E|nr:transcription factor HHO5 isoform X3 [Trifolium pratense]
MEQQKQQLNLDLTLALASVPKTVSHFLNDVVSQTNNSSEKLSNLDDLVHRLEEEMNKVLAFKRELPLCIILLNNAIETLKEEKEKVRLMKMEDPKNSSDNKKNWMNSVHLWTNENNSNEDVERCVSKKSNGGGVFMEFNGNSLKEVSQVPSYSLVSEVSHGNSKSGGSSGSSLLRVETQNQPQPPHPLQQNSRKQRRSWSSELHRRFVDALQQLGGAHVATPKQIREKMQVDGLTNDEVKSHLQKYRLHVRRFPVSSIEEANKLALYMTQDHREDTSKGNISESLSPQGPLTPLLLGGSVKGLSSHGRNSMDADDEQSDCRNWKGDHEQLHEAE